MSLMVFPNQEDLSRFSQISQERIAPLIKQLFAQKFGIQCFFYQSKSYKERVYFQCSRNQCQAKLRFELVQYSVEERSSIFSLVSYNLNHNHGLQLDKVPNLVRWGELMQKIIVDLPEDMALSEKKKYVQTLVPISDKQFYYAHSNLLIATNKFKSLLSSLEAKDCHISYDTYGQEQRRYPNILVVSTKNMKELYLKYGRCVRFDFTFSPINQKSYQMSQDGQVRSGKQFLLGFFTGVNQYNKVIIFGYTICCKQDKASINKVFSAFFGQQMGKWPETFVTDEEISFKYALQDIKAADPQIKTQHLLDPFHVLKKLQFPYEFQKLASNVLMSTTEQQYRQNLYALRINCQSNGLVDQLDSYKTKCCFAFISSYVGLSINKQRYQYIHNIVKRKIQGHKTYINVTEQFLELCQKTNKNSFQSSLCQFVKGPLGQLMNWEELEIMVKKLCKKAMKFILSEITKSISLISETEVENGQRVYKVYEKDRQYRISRSNTNDQFECNCNLKAKTDLICSHIVRVCAIAKVSILSQLRPTWIIQVPEPESL